MVDRCEVIFARILHEPIHIPHDEADVRLGASQVLQCVNNAVIVCYVHLLYNVGRGQLLPLLHWCFT